VGLLAKFIFKILKFHLQNFGRQILKKGFGLEFCNFEPEILCNASLFISGEIPRSKQINIRNR
jgi:hypothetical protein